ncbi:hypothetical protein [uncultured Prevotella sp.]|uniref:hypothetical protein n=1 Tax=uncultured Prevotella sp. TaxID=159272 RepID=UPI0027E2A3E7|nr:hypothetical protein [uncultured Prevotella sp.]
MKRNLLKSLFVTLVLVFTAIAAQAQCYIIGNDGKWLTNEAGAELQPTTEDGVYEGDVVFDDSQYFFVCTKLMDNPYDWDELLPYRYGPGTTVDFPIVYNKPLELTPAIETYNSTYKVADLGTHKIRVDFNAMTVTVDGTYPEHIYMMGTDGEWTLGVPSATLNHVEGTNLYKAKVEFTSNYFAFFKQMADTWEEQNLNRWIVKGEVLPNTELSLVKVFDKSSSYINRLGTYEVTFDYSNNTAMLYDETYVPEPETVIYFIGDDNNWALNTYFAKIPEVSDGVYEGQVKFGVGYFIIGTKLGNTINDWDTFNAHRFSSQADGEPIGAYSESPIFKNRGNYSSSFQIETGNEGEYVVTVDTNEMKIKFSGLVGISITNITSASDNITNYYDLTGRNLGTKKPAKGLYIKDGKKVVVK